MQLDEVVVVEVEVEPEVEPEVEVEVEPEPEVDELTTEQTYLVKSKVDPDGQTTQAFWFIS